MHTMRIRLLMVALLAMAGVVQAANPQILVPLYSYPNWYSPGTYTWGQVAAAAATAPITAIINPDNGPAGPPNSDFLHGMSDLQKAGVRMVGYVPTGYGKTPVATVEANVDLYANDYPGVTGIFLDEASTDPSTLTYYTTLYNYIKAKSNLTLVITNPGTNIPESFVSAPTCDTAVIYEDTTGWPAYTPDSYVANDTPQHFAALILDIPTAAQMQADIALAVQRNVGYVYVTDRTTPNPYNLLPSYWTQEVNDIGGVQPLTTTQVAAKSETLGQLGTLNSAGPAAINAAGNVALRVATSSGGGIGLITGGTYNSVAAVGAAAPDMTGTASVGTFTKLSDPVLNANSAIAFIGTLKTERADITASNDSGIWCNTSGTLQLIARKGSIAPGSGGTYSAFTQVVLPDVAGPIFCAKLSGVPASQNTGLWAVTGSNGIQPVIITGQQLPFTSGTAAPTLKTVKSISIFQQPPLASGQSRGVDTSTANLVCQATFTDATWAIYKVTFP